MGRKYYFMRCPVCGAENTYTETGREPSHYTDDPVKYYDWIKQWFSCGCMTSYNWLDPEEFECYCPKAYWVLLGMSDNLMAANKMLKDAQKEIENLKGEHASRLDSC